MNKWINVNDPFSNYELKTAAQLSNENTRLKDENNALKDEIAILKTENMALRDATPRDAWRVWDQQKGWGVVLGNDQPTDAKNLNSKKIRVVVENGKAFELTRSAMKILPSKAERIAAAKAKLTPEELSLLGLDK